MEVIISFFPNTVSCSVLLFLYQFMIQLICALGIPSLINIVFNLSRLILLNVSVRSGKALYPFLFFFDACYEMIHAVTTGFIFYESIRSLRKYFEMRYNCDAYSKLFIFSPTSSASTADDFFSGEPSPTNFAPAQVPKHIYPSLT